MWLMFFSSFIVFFQVVSCTKLGVNVHFMAPKDGELDMIKNLTSIYTMMDLYWDVVEKIKGEYQFSEYDKHIPVLLERGIIPYMIFDYGNPFYDEGLSPYSDEGREAFSNFALACVERYQGKGVIWEIWNEPNIHFWKPTPNATNYCKLANVVIDKIKSKFPNELVVGPSLSKVDLDFMEVVFQAGLLDKFDAISVHPFENKPEKATEQYEDLKKLMDKYGKRKPIYSDWGFTDYKMGPTKQAEVTSRMLAVNDIADVEISIYYDFHDDGKNKSYSEHHFGLVHYDYHEGSTPVYDIKQSYLAAQAYTRLRKDFKFKTVHDSALWHRVVEYQHAVGNSTLSSFSVWSTVDLKQHIEITVGKGNSFNVYDYLGQSMGKKSGDDKGKLKVSESTGVVYLIPV